MQKIKNRRKSRYIGVLRYYRILASPKFFPAYGILPVLPLSSKSQLLPLFIKFQNFPSLLP